MKILDRLFRRENRAAQRFTYGGPVPEWIAILHPTIMALLSTGVARPGTGGHRQGRSGAGRSGGFGRDGRLLDRSSG